MGLQCTSFSSKEQTWLDLCWSALLCLDLIWYVCFGLGKLKFHYGNIANAIPRFLFQSTIYKQLISVFLGIVRQFREFTHILRIFKSKSLGWICNDLGTDWLHFSGVIKAISVPSTLVFYQIEPLKNEPSLILPS